MVKLNIAYLDNAWSGNHCVSKLSRYYPVRLYDAAFFCWHHNSSLNGMSTHVDNFCWAGIKIFEKLVI